VWLFSSHGIFRGGWHVSFLLKKKVLWNVDLRDGQHISVLVLFTRDLQMSFLSLKVKVLVLKVFCLEIESLILGRIFYLVGMIIFFSPWG